MQTWCYYRMHLITCYFQYWFRDNFLVGVDKYISVNVNCSWFFLPNMCTCAPLGPVYVHTTNRKLQVNLLLSTKVTGWLKWGLNTSLMPCNAFFFFFFLRFQLTTKSTTAFDTSLSGGAEQHGKCESLLEGCMETQRRPRSHRMSSFFITPSIL